MQRRFDIEEARALIPAVREVETELIPLRADLAARVREQRDGAEGGLAEIKALEARVSELLDGLTAKGIQVKGYAPLLVDFPHRHGDRDLLLCWLEGEADLRWYHDVADGFMGRRRIADLG